MRNFEVGDVVRIVKSFWEWMNDSSNETGRWGRIEGIDPDGNLFNECCNIPKEGKYIIQFFPSGMYMRY